MSRDGEASSDAAAQGTCNMSRLLRETVRGGGGSVTVDSTLADDQYIPVRLVP